MIDAIAGHRRFGVRLADCWINVLVENDIARGEHLSASEETLSLEMIEADRTFNRAVAAAEWPVPYRPTNWVQGIVTLRYDN